MASRTTSRRRFIITSGAALGSSYLALNFTAALAAGDTAEASKAQGAAWQTLSQAQADALGAVADQIYPPDDTPGAAEIGAVYYMDTALGGFMAGAMPAVEAGVAALDGAAADAGGVRFAELDFDAQKAVLEQLENEPFFGLFHFMTVCGLFCLPSYGGNREKAGWAALGFEAQHVWQPPFGHYDAEYAREASHASA